MSSPILDQALQDYRWNLNELLHSIQRLATAINNAKLQETVAGLRRNIAEPFLFVVVGEVKAGKSSFVNALLEAEVCATDIEPCTDSIQQIVYSDNRYVTQIEPNLRKIGLPIEILKDISIVDTPGTNTIVAEHQIITEKYIPNSDLTFLSCLPKIPIKKAPGIFSISSVPSGARRWYSFCNRPICSNLPICKLILSGSRNMLTKSKSNRQLCLPPQ
ncbi:MAG: dynamin family protein [Leptolyngbya sp. IPPAS B-1204]